MTKDHDPHPTHNPPERFEEFWDDPDTYLKHRRAERSRGPFGGAVVLAIVGGAIIWVIVAWIVVARYF